LAAATLNTPGHSLTRITLRPGDDGDVEAQVAAVRVWEWSEGEAAPVELWLLIRQMPDHSLKLSLCNAGAATPLRRLAGWQAARFYVERCFQDAKATAAWRNIRPGGGSRGTITWRS
jgi:hypothetical protein